MLLPTWIILAALEPAAAAAAPPLGSGGLDPVDLDPAVAGLARLVVAIQVEREPEPATPLRRRFGLGAGQRQEVQEYYRRPPGPASGLLLDARGNVLTTHYNVSGTLKSIEVVLPGGARREAKLIATDKSDDLALLRLVDPPADLQPDPVPWAAPADLRVGRIVVALGRSPDPTRPTATFGIVSALGRNGGRAFQTDAELNYGNVGGPLADIDGRVVGLAGFVGHTFRQWGQNSGIGFGTTAETIHAVLPQLLRGENVQAPERPLLGVMMAERSAEGGRGARIGTVQGGSAAEQAGLKPDDVVLRFDGEEVEDFIDLRRRISRKRPGDEVTLTVQRGAESLELRARLGKRAD